MNAVFARFSDPDRLTGGIVAVAVLVLIAVRLVAAGLTELGADETYYWLWAQHLSWGYFDHPPMVAWWIAAGTAIFGDNPFGVRVVFVLSGIVTSLAVYGTARTLFDRPTALLGTLWINATLLVGVGAISATPDAPSVLFWELATWALARVVVTGNGVWWLAVGLFAGLGVTSKLTDLFLGLGLILLLVIRRDLRHWLASPWLWAGGIIAAAVAAPMIVWNAGHDWMTFASQFRRVGQGGFAPLRLPEMIATQFALLNPVIGLFVGLAIVAWLRRLQGYPTPALGLLFWTVLPLVAYMAWHALRTQVPGNWLAPIFPTLAIVAAAAAVAAPAEKWAPLRALAFPLGVGLSLIGLALAANPGGVLPTWFDAGRANRGWAGVAADAERLRQEVGATWFATTHYNSDAALAYYLRGGDTTAVAVTGRQRYAFAPDPPDGLRDEPGLLVADSDAAAKIAGCFATMTEAGVIERRAGTTIIATMTAYRVTGLAADAFVRGCDRIGEAAD